MTEQEIGKLRALATDLRERNLNLRHAAGMEELTRGQPVPGDNILRLLEERRRLLEAMDSIIGQVEDACINDCGICRFCVSEGVARKAIAFAEEESK